MHWLRSRVYGQLLCCCPPSKRSVKLLKSLPRNKGKAGGVLEARLVSGDTCKALKMQVLHLAFDWASQAELKSKLTLASPATSHTYLFTTPKPHLGADITKSLGLLSIRKGPHFLWTSVRKTVLICWRMTSANTNDLPGHRLHSRKAIFSTPWGIHLMVNLPGSTWKPKPYLYIGYLLGIEHIFYLDPIEGLSISVLSVTMLLERGGFIWLTGYIRHPEMSGQKLTQRL